MNKHVMSLPRVEYDALVKDLANALTSNRNLNDKIRDLQMNFAPAKIAIVVSGQSYHCARSGKIHYVEGNDAFKKFIQEGFMDKDDEIEELQASYDLLDTKHKALRELLREALR